MLSAVGKLGAYHLQYYRDRAVLEAVNEIESLGNGLSRKLWQKIMVINHMAEVHAREAQLRIDYHRALDSQITILDRE
jgi:hypothetical protein